MNKMYLLFFIVFSFNQFAQPQDPLSYFPHKVGDRWKYYYPEDSQMEIEKVTSVKKENENIFIYMDNVLNYKIDTSLFVYRYPQDTISFNWSWYKLNADSGYYWRVKKMDYEGGYYVARIDDVFEGIVFGKTTQIKKIGYYYQAYYDSTDFSRWVESRYLAAGFGLLQVDAEGQMYPYVKIITGCIIDGISYGDLVGVNENNGIVKDFELFQNYPNPFNPSTIISYNLESNCLVKLTVNDILGNVVVLLIDKYKPAGTYSILFNASGLSAGVYFYKLTTGGRTEVRKMLYLK